MHSIFFKIETEIKNYLNRVPGYLLNLVGTAAYLSDDR
eukprot:SAG11_NODE_32124_length_286_cov_0.818182_1_plen_37_part_01